MIELNFSEHARSRIRQRGLRERDVQAMVGRAEGEAEVGQGLVSLFLTSRQRRERRGGMGGDQLPGSGGGAHRRRLSQGQLVRQ